MATTRTAGAAKKQELMASDTSFLNDFAGAGLDEIKQENQAVSYLSMIQPGSSLIDDDNPVGTWRNSATGKNYGEIVRVIPLAFKCIWNERQSEAPYATVAKYEPNSIEVEMRQPPAGSRGYPKMINPATGNEIQELYVYPVILPDHPEDGVLYFNPTIGSMKALRAWNTQLQSQLLDNGLRAPIFAFSWMLCLALAPNPKKPTEKITKLVKVQKDALCSKELFTDTVQPQLKIVSNSLLQIASDEDDTDNN